MNLDRDTILSLLPCYICGDLPPEVAERIAARLDGDAELQARVEQLGLVRTECSGVLAATLAELPELSEILAQVKLTPQGSAPAPPVRLWGLWVGLAAAALLTLGMASADPTPREQAFFSVTTDLGASARAVNAPLAGLLDAGVEPRLAMAPDLSALGFKLLTVLPLRTPTPGVAAVYEKDGKRYVCQIYADAGAHGIPDEVRTVRGTTLRGYRQGSASIVSWVGGGRLCVFGGEARLDELFAVVSARLTGRS